MHTTDYKTYHLEWASDYVLSQAMMESRKKGKLDMEVDAFTKQSSTWEELEPAAEELWKSYVHGRFIEGVTLQCRTLQEEEQDEECPN